MMKNYKDLLHVPSAELVVEFNGKPVYMMNKRLLDQQNCWSNLEDIKEVHWLKLMFYEMINKTDNPIELKDLVKDVEQCEFELQKLWKFTVDAKFHRWWEYPKCSCPKIDNNDNYPTGYYIIDLSCLLHGTK